MLVYKISFSVLSAHLQQSRAPRPWDSVERSFHRGDRQAVERQSPVPVWQKDARRISLIILSEWNRGGTHFRRTPFQTSSRTSSPTGTSYHSHVSKPTSRRCSADNVVYVSWNVGDVAPRPWKKLKRDSGPARRLGRCWKKALSSVKGRA